MIEKTRKPAFDIRLWRSRSGEPVDFGGENEIGLGEAVDSVGPEGDFDFSPGEKNVGMVALLLGEISDAVDEGQGGFEVGKLESANDVMLVDDAPLGEIGELLMDLSESGAAEGGNSSSAGNAVTIGEHLDDPLSQLAEKSIRRTDATTRAKAPVPLLGLARPYPGPLFHGSAMVRESFKTVDPIQFAKKLTRTGYLRR
jgi:hypothetical protein